jgi:hypothetical protein
MIQFLPTFLDSIPLGSRLFSQRRITVLAEISFPLSLRPLQNSAGVNALKSITPKLLNSGELVNPLAAFVFLMYHILF